MKQALISPNEAPIQYVSGWTTDVPPQPIYSQIEQSCRIAQVEAQSFEVAPPLFWVECADNTDGRFDYFSLNDNEIYPIPATPPQPE